MPTKLPIHKRGNGPDNDKFIELTSECSNTKHTILKDHIVRWCPSTNFAPGTRIWFRTGENLVVLESYEDITKALTEKVQ